MTDVRRAVACLGAVAMCVAGCGSSATTADAAVPSRDAGPVMHDAPPSHSVDRDHDGLCDDSEAMAGTDPTLADTDGDGLTDLYEWRAGYDPTRSSDPPAVDRAQLHEAPTETVVVAHDALLDNAATVVDALWQDRAAGVDGRLASAWAAVTITAVGADPASSVQEIDGTRFVGVSGLARLQWRIDVRSRAGAAGGDAGVVRLGCRRAYEFVVEVSAAGGDGLRVRRITLDVLPAAGANGWPQVDPDGFCEATACE